MGATRLEEQLAGIVASTAWLLEALRAARDCAAPDWAIGAGALRNAVWDHLHGHRTPTPLKDVDLAFFDPADLSRARDLEVEQALTRRLPGVAWDAKNQAAVHTWYERRFGVAVEPLTSTADGVATWPETATAVALALGPGDELRVIAPCGLEDLLGGICRRNPRRVTLEAYRRRVEEKQIARRWPLVRILDG